MGRSVGIGDRSALGAETLKYQAEAMVADLDAALTQAAPKAFAVEPGQDGGDLAGSGHEVLNVLIGACLPGRSGMGGGPDSHF